MQGLSKGHPVWLIVSMVGSPWHVSVLPLLMGSEGNGLFINAGFRMMRSRWVAMTGVCDLIGVRASCVIALAGADHSVLP